MKVPKIVRAGCNKRICTKRISTYVKEREMRGSEMRGNERAASRRASSVQWLNWVKGVKLGENTTWMSREGHL